MNTSKKTYTILIASFAALYLVFPSSVFTDMQALYNPSEYTPIDEKDRWPDENRKGIPHPNRALINVNRAYAERFARDKAKRRADMHWLKRYPLVASEYIFDLNFDMDVISRVFSHVIIPLDSDDPKAPYGLTPLIERQHPPTLEKYKEMPVYVPTEGFEYGEMMYLNAVKKETKGLLGTYVTYEDPEDVVAGKELDISSFSHFVDVLTRDAPNEEVKKNVKKEIRYLTRKESIGSHVKSVIPSNSAAFFGRPSLYRVDQELKDPALDKRQQIFESVEGKDRIVTVYGIAATTNDLHKVELAGTLHFIEHNNPINITHLVTLNRKDGIYPTLKFSVSPSGTNSSCNIVSALRDSERQLDRNVHFVVDIEYLYSQAEQEKVYNPTKAKPKKSQATTFHNKQQFLLGTITAPRTLPFKSFRVLGSEEEIAHLNGLIPFVYREGDNLMLELTTPVESEQYKRRHAILHSISSSAIQQSKVSLMTLRQGFLLSVINENSLFTKGINNRAFYSSPYTIASYNKIKHANRYSQLDTLAISGGTYVGLGNAGLLFNIRYETNSIEQAEVNSLAKSEAHLNSISATIGTNLRLHDHLGVDVLTSIVRDDSATDNSISVASLVSRDQKELYSTTLSNKNTRGDTSFEITARLKFPYYSQNGDLVVQPEVTPTYKIDNIAGSSSSTNAAATLPNHKVETFTLYTGLTAGIMKKIFGGHIYGLLSVKTLIHSDLYAPSDFDYAKLARTSLRNQMNTVRLSGEIGCELENGLSARCSVNVSPNSTDEMYGFSFGLQQRL